MTNTSWCDLCNEEHTMTDNECKRLSGDAWQRAVDLVQMDWLKAQARARCLHVGCGEKYLPGMVNIDPNPDRSKVDYRYDVHDLPFEDSTFDSAISCHVLPSLQDPVQAMREMARVLKPGGVMAHVVPDNRYAPMRHSKHHPWQFQHYNWFGPDHFRAEVLNQLADLSIVCCEHFGGFRFSFKVLCKKR